MSGCVWSRCVLCCLLVPSHGCAPTPTPHPPARPPPQTHLQPPSTGYIEELRRRERELGIEPDAEVDALQKAEASAEGKRSSIITDLMLRILGLEVGRLEGWLCEAGGVAAAAWWHMSAPCGAVQGPDTLLAVGRTLAPPAT